ncbi:MAG: DUF4389 domain-containing protein [Dehalococcoidia bacterium]|nr:DUF4389 domain-containing protein [Dehalococcoidia bacterium]
MSEYSVEWTDASGASQKRDLPEGGLTIGRSPASDIVLADTKVSGSHARLRREGIRVFLQDSDSTNGTYVNGQRISLETDIRPSDEVVIGDTRLWLIAPSLNTTEVGTPVFSDQTVVGAPLPGGQEAPAPAMERSGYPVRFDVRRPEKSSRLLNFPLGIGMLIKYVLLIPHLLILFLLSIIVSLFIGIGPFAILFTGRYPRGLFNFVVGTYRWTGRTMAYVLSLTDRYPAFTMDAEPDDDVTLEVDYPERLSRILNFPLGIGMLIKTVLAIPVFIVVYVGLLIAMILVFIAQFAILFTGRFPKGMHGFLVGAVQAYNRVLFYILGLTDAYPPFSLARR